MQSLREEFNRKVYFNEAHPENMNIYISSMKTDYLMMYRDNNWNIVDRNYHIDSFIVAMRCNWKIGMMNTKISIHTSYRNSNAICVIENIMKRDNVKKDILRMLYNKRKFIKKISNYKNWVSGILMKKTRKKRTKVLLS